MEHHSATGGYQASTNASRRQLLRLGVVGGLSLAAGSVLSACSSAAPAASTAAPAPATAAPGAATPAQPASAPKPTQAAAAPTRAAAAAPASLPAGSMHYISEDTADVDVNQQKAIDADFMARYPNVSVTGEYLNTNTDFFPKIQTTLAAHNPPEFVPRSAFARVVTLANLGVLEPMNDVLDTIGTGDFLPGSLDQYKLGSDYFGLPLDKVTIAFWYRKDLAQQAGVKAPTNWDELLAFAKALTTGGTYGFTLPYGRTALTNQYLFVLLRQNGGNIVDPDLNVVFDSPATVQAVEFMAELAQYSPPASANYGSPEVVTSFTSGQSASTCYYGRMIQSVASMSPQLSPSLGAALWPYSKQPFTIANAAGPYVFKDAQRKDAAKVWIGQFEYDPKHYLAHIATAPGNYLPQRQSVVQSPDYLNLPLIQANPDALNVLNQSAQMGGNEAKESPQHKINPAGGTIDTGTILADVVQRVLVNHESAQSAVTWGHQQLVDVVKTAVSG